MTAKKKQKNTKKFQNYYKINEGNKRIYAPTVIFVSNGKIVGMDSETAKDTKGYKNPEEYWTDKRVKALKERLDKYSKLAKEVICSDCNKQAQMCLLFRANGVLKKKEFIDFCNGNKRWKSIKNTYWNCNFKQSPK